MKEYIVRNNQVEQIWKVTYSINNFSYSLFIQSTENELHDYLNTEMGYVGSYYALADKEIESVKNLHIPIYIAPIIKQ